MDEKILAEKVGALEQTFNRVQHYVREELEARRRRLRRGVALRVFLLVLVFGYLSFMFNYVRQLTAEAVADKIEIIVGDAMDRVEVKLKNPPPDLDERVRRFLVEDMDQHRQDLYGFGTKLIDASVRRYEPDFEYTVSQSFEDFRSHANDSLAGHSPEEQATILVDELFKQLKKDVMAHAGENDEFRSYSLTMREVNHYLKAYAGVQDETAPPLLMDEFSVERRKRVFATIRSLLAVLHSLGYKEILPIEKEEPAKKG